MLSDKIMEYLSKNLLFENIPAEELQKLNDSLFQMREYKKGDLIIAQNADPDGIYLILKGSVSITKSTMKDTASDEENKEVILNYCSKNEFVGELALVSNKKRAANVYCFSEICKIIFVNTDDFYKIYEIIPGIQKNLGKTIAERLGETSIRAANESSKYKKLYELQLENSMRTTELLKSQKEFEKKNQELVQNQKEIKRAAIVETILTMVNSVNYDFAETIKNAVDAFGNLKDMIHDDGNGKVSAEIEKLGTALEEINHKLSLYSDNSTLEFGFDDNGKKIIVFKKQE
ncbi:MAG TPA: cyclic nucleotide-binding domain-containing protein [Clostridiales bacterium]|nr:cyclic nucleotide-binding domain-containing protein [Clostridiales bacterium]HQP68909.1 cyclic nucleotide-binding domain-containing protein [Clostridiales bacterium]